MNMLSAVNSEQDTDKRRDYKILMTDKKVVSQYSETYSWIIIFIDEVQVV